MYFFHFLFYCRKIICDFHNIIFKEDIIMSVYRDEKRGTWTVSVYYRDYENTVHRKTKRGFVTKHEALEWERHFVLLKSYLNQNNLFLFL